MLVKNKSGLLEDIYIKDIFVGLWITIRNFLFVKSVTVQYPEERRDYSERFRGMHYIKATNGVENCTACMLCPTVCPAECIHIEAGERDDKEKYPIKFEIDVLRCCFCGFCEEACPKDAIKLSSIYEMSQEGREVYEKDYLLEQRGSK
ncbi:MAG: NADH-quinone oxidoreductase subunit NuoI [Bdellovibrionota bacterium]